MFTRSLTMTVCVAIAATAGSAREGGADDVAGYGRARDAVAIQIDVGHSGVTSFTTAMKLPLRKVWQHRFGGSVSYPLIARDRVFVTVRRAGNSQPGGSTLYALSAKTGAMLWSRVIESLWYWSATAYDSGRVFVVNTDGLLSAFDEKTGDLDWNTQIPNEYFVDSPPVARDGIVYVEGAGSNTVTAYRAETGELIWLQYIEAGALGSPALSNEGIFTSSDCHVFAFDRFSGTPLWTVTAGCLGGLGYLAYKGGALYVSDPLGAGNRIIDAASGVVLGTFDANAFKEYAGAATVGKERAYYLANGVLEAFSVPLQRFLWSFSGDHGLMTQSPIQVNGTVFVGSDSGMLWGLDARSGKVLWSTNVGSPIRSDVCCGNPSTGLAAGNGLLVIPADHTLTAFGSALRDRPAPDENTGDPD
jgi:outer membrane protein assembly factor BamB